MSSGVDVDNQCNDDHDDGNKWCRLGHSRLSAQFSWMLAAHAGRRCYECLADWLANLAGVLAFVGRFGWVRFEVTFVSASQCVSVYVYVFMSLAFIGIINIISLLWLQLLLLILMLFLL